MDTGLPKLFAAARPCSKLQIDCIGKQPWPLLDALTGQSRERPRYEAEADLHLLNILVADTMVSKSREVMLSASMMASETHRIQPVAPVCQSLISPGAQPLCLAKGPKIPNPGQHRPLSFSDIHRISSIKLQAQTLSPAKSQSSF